MDRQQLYNDLIENLKTHNVINVSPQTIHNIWFPNQNTHEHQFHSALVEFVRDTPLHYVTVINNGRPEKIKFWRDPEIKQIEGGNDVDN